MCKVFNAALHGALGRTFDSASALPLLRLNPLPQGLRKPCESSGCIREGRPGRVQSAKALSPCSSCSVSATPSRCATSRSR